MTLKCFPLQREPSSHYSQSRSWQCSRCRSLVVRYAQPPWLPLFFFFFFFFLPPPPPPPPPPPLHLPTRPHSSSSSSSSSLLLLGWAKPGSPMTAGGYPAPHRCVVRGRRESARGRKAGSELWSCAPLLLLFLQGGILLVFSGAELHIRLLCCWEPESLTSTGIETWSLQWSKRDRRDVGWWLLTHHLWRYSENYKQLWLISA